MSTPENVAGSSTEFEQRYGRIVADLMIQKRFHCHDATWLKMAAGQLTDKVCDTSSLDRETVRADLNNLWSQIQIEGPVSYLERTA